MTLGKEPFASEIVPRALCQKLPLGKACAERKEPSVVSTWLMANVWIPVVVLASQPYYDVT
jgi:hypothetical protein